MKEKRRERKRKRRRERKKGQAVNSRSNPIAVEGSDCVLSRRGSCRRCRRRRRRVNGVGAPLFQSRRSRVLPAVGRLERGRRRRRPRGRGHVDGRQKGCRRRGRGRRSLFLDGRRGRSRAAKPRNGAGNGGGAGRFRGTRVESVVDASPISRGGVDRDGRDGRQSTPLSRPKAVEGGLVDPPQSRHLRPMSGGEESDSALHRVRCSSCLRQDGRLRRLSQRLHLFLSFFSSFFF